ncbi:NADase-type glycan-binding domain-containing protein [Streptomyces griseoruber]|uniref:NADase-type glycan-binding domain-containing protein n=1 Tax=Streptomyces griseoruber TaxID=1943 RepID=UPI0037A88FAC
MTTQNCAECGTRAEPGQSFCDACGAVLSWTDRDRDRAPARAGTAGAGAAAASSASSATTAAAPSSSARTRDEAGRAEDGEDEDRAPAGPTADDRSREPRTTGDSDHDEDGDGTAGGTDEDDEDDEDTTETPLPPLPPTTDTTSAAATPDTDGTAPTTPTPALGDTMAARARSLLVPVADPEEPAPAPPSVAPVLPGVPVADRPQVRAPGPVQGELNGIACPWCATPNRPDRHYCSRCAMPMTLEDRSSIRLPWWRRLFGRGGETPWAGDRPRLRRTFDRILTWVMAAVVLTLLITAGVKAPDAIQATKDHFAKRAAVSPDTYAASRSYPGHKPDLAFDKINNSWWGPGVSQSGEGEWIEARFNEPTRLLDLVITPGTSTRAEQLTESALPHRVKAAITLKDGTTATRELVLDQQAGGQRRAFRVGEVTKVRFTIESAYGASASKQVAIAEIEFFGPSSANGS